MNLFLLMVGIGAVSALMALIVTVLDTVNRYTNQVDATPPSTRNAEDAEL